MRVDISERKTHPHTKTVYISIDSHGIEREGKAHWVSVRTGKTVCGFTFHNEHRLAELDDEMCARCQELVDARRVIGFEEEEWE